MVEIEVVFGERLHGGASIVWGSLIQPLKKFNENAVVDGFTGKEILFSEVSNYLMSNKCRSFFIELASGSVEFSYVADKEFYRLDIKSLVNSIETAQSLIEALINVSSFVQARVYDAEYERWQNAENLTLFEAECIEHAHLPKKSNGLPFPLTQEIVDISKNPGRWVLRAGYIEAVGAFMWVSKSLLQVMGVNEKKLMDVDCFSIEDLGSVVKIAAYDRCFTSAVGAEAERQALLRKVLFNA
jgi:hypothetical protein